MTDILNARFGSTAVERCLVVDGLPSARFWPLRLTPNTTEYRSDRTFRAKRGSAQAPATGAGG